jgi:hypothetical protein
MVRDIDSDVVKQIRKLYEKSEAAKAFFEWAADRQKDAAETRIERLEYMADLGHREAIELARTLSEIGCGEFVVGRRGAKSRVKWNYSLRSMGEAAKGEIAELKHVSSEAEQDDDLEDEVEIEENAIRHTFQLRPDNTVTIDLPSDLSKKEAERLATFIQSLPFDA